MTRAFMRRDILLALVLGPLTVAGFAQAGLIPSTRLINPDDLLKILFRPKRLLDNGDPPLRERSRKEFHVSRLQDTRNSKAA